MLNGNIRVHLNSFLVTFTIASPFTSTQAMAQGNAGSSDLSTEQKFDFIAGSIGDSITAAMDARRPLDNREINWSTGTRSSKMVNSHALRLRALMPDISIGTKNFAVSGSKSADVVRQAHHLAKFHPDYVTVLIGANDVCAWSSDHDAQLAAYETDIRTILKSLIASNDNIKILVSAIPNMPLLRDIGAANGCQSRWNTLHICPALLGADRTDEDRMAFADRWQDANHVLAKVSSEFTEHVKFASTIAEPIFTMSHVSRLDCFHPNVSGQDFLSEMTWADGWYY